jgi:hypothetical protein
MNDAREQAEDQDRDMSVEEAEREAAAEAAAIGGPAGDDAVSDEERPLVESGEGVAEGFEQAEAELIERAEHGDGGYPGAAEFADETEDARAAVHGEPDELDTTEKVRDPREGPDDPGAGPGLSAER